MYGFSVERDGTVEAVAEEVTAALKVEGFGVLTTIDVAATLKEKIGHDQRPYLILGACNPQFAKDAIAREPDIGLLLPCNVVVREVTDGRVAVSFMDPQSVLALVESSELAALGADAKARLQRVRDAVAG